MTIRPEHSTGFITKLTSSSPPYIVTIGITILGFVANFGIERYMDSRKEYSSEISDLKTASGEFIALGGEFTLPIINKDKPNQTIRSELSKNILKQITILSNIQTSSSSEASALIKDYAGELEKTKILVDKTNSFDQLQALYQRFSSTRSSWKRLNRAL